jgi:hypothetical protein
VIPSRPPPSLLSRALRPVLRPPFRSPFERGIGGFSPAQVFTGSAAGLWLDPSDISTGFQDSAGTTPQTASGQPTGKRLDKSGRGNHVLQASAGARPEYDVIGGISSDFMDGSDDGYSTAAFAGGTLTSTMDCFVAVKRTSTAKGVVCCQTSAAVTEFFGVFDSAGGATLATGAGAGAVATYKVNGVDLNGGAAGTTRVQLDTSLVNGSWSVLEIYGLNLSAWTQFMLGGYSGFMLAADIGGVIACPAQSAANRTALRKWLGAKVGLSLS